MSNFEGCRIHLQADVADIECPNCTGIAEYSETRAGLHFFICHTCETIHRRSAADSATGEKTDG